MSTDADFPTQLFEGSPEAVIAASPGDEVRWNRTARRGPPPREGEDPASSTCRPPTELQSGLAEATQAGNTQATGTIFVISDMPANLAFARTTLQSAGYRVILAGSVNRAFSLIEGTQPDLVLCDLHMQPLDGFDFLEIAKRTPALGHAPIVIISSTCTLERDRRNCLEHGAVRFIRRPIPPEALLAEIAEALNAIRRGGSHENPDC